jgi:hypothetical protein
VHTDVRVFFKYIWEYEAVRIPRQDHTHPIATHPTNSSQPCKMMSYRPRAIEIKEGNEVRISILDSRPTLNG